MNLSQSVMGGQWCSALGKCIEFSSICCVCRGGRGGGGGPIVGLTIGVPLNPSPGHVSLNINSTCQIVLDILLASSLAPATHPAIFEHDLWFFNSGIYLGA